MSDSVDRTATEARPTTAELDAWAAWPNRSVLYNRDAVGHFTHDVDTERILDALLAERSERAAFIAELMTQRDSLVERAHEAEAECREQGDDSAHWYRECQSAMDQRDGDRAEVERLGQQLHEARERITQYESRVPTLNSLIDSAERDAESSGVLAVQIAAERDVVRQQLAAVRPAVVAALTSERIGGRDPSGTETTVRVYADEAAAVADEVLGTLAAAAVPVQPEPQETKP